MLDQLSPKTIIEAKTITRAIIYARVSTDEQAETGTSLDNQVEKSSEYAESVGLYVPDGFIFREDYTGKVLNRPELNKVRELIRTGQADALIVYKPNRLDRSEWGINLLLLMRELKEFGIDFHYSQDHRQVDLNNPMEAFMYGSFAGWQAGEDHAETVRKLRDGRIGKVKAGYVMVFGNPPYGYRDVKTNGGYLLEIHEPEAEIVRLMFQWYIVGDESGKPLTLGAISRKLNQMGVPTKRGEKWRNTNIRQILLRETYCGIWHYSKLSSNPIPVEIDSIVSREAWQAAQERLEFNKKHATRNRKPGRYLVANRVECADCGYSLSGTNRSRGKHHYFYYTHNWNVTSHHTNPDNGKVYNADKVDTRVWKWVEEIATDKNKLLAGLKDYQAEKQAEVEPIKREMELTEKLYQEKTHELHEEIETLKILTSPRAKAKKAADIELIENQLDSLEEKKAAYKKRLEVEDISDEQIMGLVEFTSQVATDLATLKGQESDDPKIKIMIFEAKRLLIEKLNIHVELFRLNGQEKVKITAKIKPKGVVLSIENNNTKPVFQ